MTADTSWLTPRQRILQRSRKRVSVRLEEEFWVQLEACAKEDGLKMTDLVFQLFEQAGDDINRSSVLRAYCVRWLRNKLAQVRLSSSDADLQVILSACDVPCVVITAEKKLVAHNHAFADKVLSSIVPPDQWDQAQSFVRFSLSKPINQIFDAVIASKVGYTEAHVAFSKDQGVVPMIGRFCLLNRRAVDSSPLLCFLMKRKRRK
ncbi:MAG: ribbon-helix-helix domain-containing protein [Methyloligellaceae bacterium]